MLFIIFTVLLISGSVMLDDADYLSWRSAKTHCDDEEKALKPCDCCKIRCWYDAYDGEAVVVKKFLPPLSGDSGVIGTLKRIKSCIRDNCRTTVCSSKMDKRAGARLNQEDNFEFRPF